MSSGSWKLSFQILFGKRFMCFWKYSTERFKRSIWSVLFPLQIPLALFHDIVFSHSWTVLFRKSILTRVSNWGNVLSNIEFSDWFDLSTMQICSCLLLVRIEDQTSFVEFFLPEFLCFHSEFTLSDQLLRKEFFQDSDLKIRWHPLPHFTTTFEISNKTNHLIWSWHYFCSNKCWQCVWILYEMIFTFKQLLHTQTKDSN